MMQYQLCDLILESNLHLRELTAVVDGRPSDFSFHLLRPFESHPEPTHWFHHWRLSDEDDAWLSFAKLDNNYLLRFPEIADFLVSADGNAVRCYPESNIPLETIRHLLVDQVLPLLLSQLGRVVLHASAVVLPAGAVAFLGKTGLGKSTLTAYLCEQGFPLVTDDCLLLEEQGTQLIAIPSYAGIRLWPDTLSVLFEREPELFPVAHYTEKKRVLMGETRLPYCTDPVPLLRAYILTDPMELDGAQEIRITAVTPREALMELVKQTYLLDISDRQKLRVRFQSLARLAGLPLFHRLGFPRDLSLLPDVREAILAHAKL
jgi:hypothetical protein